MPLCEIRTLKDHGLDLHISKGGDRVKRLYVIARYAAASLIMFYGFAKLNGSQFTILDSELDKPMGTVSGFWLTWYFFGYSTIYGAFIALAQISGAILLMFRKTTLLGSCLLLPLIVNIILIDIFYAIDLGALLVAVLIMSALLFIIYMHRQELIALFWTTQNSLFPNRQSAPQWTATIKYIVCAILIIVPAAMTYWVANYNNRSPTPLDGAWDVVSVAPVSTSAGEIPSAIFFEHNRASLCVFKYPNQKYVAHYFEVDPAKRAVTIWDHWRRKGDKIFEGQYEFDGMRLSLRGKFANGSEDTTVKLQWRDVRRE